MRGSVTLVGRVFGAWTVVEPAEAKAVHGRKWKEPAWRCRCACGLERVIRQGSLLRAERTMSKSCRACANRRKAAAQRAYQFDWQSQPLGHESDASIAKKLGCSRALVLLKRRELGIGTAFANDAAPLDGRRFGAALIVGRVGSSSNGYGMKWKCRCDCGREFTKTTAQLNQGILGCRRCALRVAGERKAKRVDVFGQGMTHRELAMLIGVHKGAIQRRLDMGLTPADGAFWMKTFHGYTVRRDDLGRATLVPFGRCARTEPR